VITAELVEVATGWQLWGESFDSARADLLQIQDAITRQLLLNLKLKLSGEEEKHVTARYTENPGAYQAYLEGRYHWSRYTRAGIEKAIGHFREAIEQDPNYALAYAAIVDCYLRLATNYLPPEEDTSEAESEISDQLESDTRFVPEVERKVKLRFEWDWKSAERELRRASELKVNYPAIHQWYAAYHYARQLLESPTPVISNPRRSSVNNLMLSPLNHIASLQLTRNEQVQVFCGVAREQIEAGNYDAACEILQSFWRFGDWPELRGLKQESAADLLFTAGELAGCVASTRQVPKGQKYGEALLSGSIAIFEHLSCKRCAAEARIELALCYYRQGLFELGRSTLIKVLETLAPDDNELRSLALIRLASLERHAGRVQDALAYLKAATKLVEAAGPWVSGRCQLELASTYKDLALLEESPVHFDNAKKFSLTALDEFEAVGNHRLAAIVQNNLGFLFSLLGEFSKAELNLHKARRTFTHFSDRIRCAQVDDSLARLYLAQGKFLEAQSAIEHSIQTIQVGDEDAVLAESLITAGRIYCALYRYHEARNAFESAYHLAWRCGDIEGGGRALLLLCEGMQETLEPQELLWIRMRLVDLLSSSQQATTKARAMRCLQMIDSAPES
jgi:tetratricopeptide (TPR) repeat protein